MASLTFPINTNKRIYFFKKKQRGDNGDDREDSRTQYIHQIRLFLKGATAF